MKKEFGENTSLEVTRGVVSEAANIERREWDTVEAVEARSREEAHVSTVELKGKLEDVFDDEVFTKQEKRELGWLLKVVENRVSEDPVENKQAQIVSFEAEITTYKRKASVEEDPLRKQTFEQAVTYCKIESDLCAWKLGRNPSTMLQKSLMERRQERNL